MSDLCSINGCAKLKHARGWCAMHWHRWYRTGSPEGAPIRTTRERFFSFLEMQGECWKWAGATGNGYGKFGFQGTAVYAHRFSWRLHRGPIEEGELVRHLCANKLCVNPDHLVLGTHADNADDAAAVGSLGHKLTWDDAEEIRGRYERGESPSVLAAEYGVTRQMVWRIGTNRSWREDIKPPPPYAVSP